MSKYKLRNTLIVLAAFTLFGAIIYASFLQEGSYTNLSVTEVKERMESGEDDFVLIDVRTLPEYTGELGHLPAAPLYPIQGLQNTYSELETYQEEEKDLIIYCRSGNRSRRAAQFLIERGFDNIYNMEGGMRAWNSQYGRPEGSETSPPNNSD